ncbi:thiol-activated cytolysin family protein [Polyangium spumosum]|uniref:Thiol-activated cytolysin C-terminal domain-containing protein n=1 Tax=Polyangium spumosum TaxID=889282 RepID=A0A6N7PSM7_9BACT|nr:thiol-activated cytolysin family protein [Polyangium spumosum]MRG93044.1 hypothetical protein [Polyangium spumosum]
MTKLRLITLLAHVGLLGTACVATTDEADSSRTGEYRQDGEIHRGEASQPLMAIAAIDIDDYIRSLDYDQRQILNVQLEGRTPTPPAREREKKGSAVIITTKTEHSLSKNLSDVALLRPTTGVIFPGALIFADHNLMEGQPVPITLPRSNMIISIDLPGLRHGWRVVEEPSNSSVQDAVVEMLEEWNARPASQGYANAARSYFEVKTAYTSRQVALELGINAKWAAGAASSQLDVSTNSETSVAIAFFKQVFYTVTLDVPSRPSAFFADSVTLADVQQMFKAERPPAYVRSVDYGRILMVRMETMSRDTRANLQGALKQVTSGGFEVGGSLRAHYEDIAKNATFTVVAIGGGAQTVTSFAGSEDDMKKLREYITNGATYRRDNPGAPISYTVAFMRDNAIATMGFTGDYTQTESVEYPNGFIKMEHRGAYVAKFEVSWEEPDFNDEYTVRKSWKSGNKTAGYSHKLDLPGDARNVKILGMAATGLIWDPWAEVLNLALPGIDNKCYRIKGTTLHRSWDTRC